MAFFVFTKVGLIFVVRDKHRGFGYGRKLATYMINDAPPGSFIVFECAPTDSIPFWQHMGAFVNNKGFGFIMRPPWKHDISDCVPSLRVQISFFSECVLDQEDTQPFYVATLRAIRKDHRTLLLEQSVCILDFGSCDSWYDSPETRPPAFVYDGLRDNFGDVVISVEVDGLLVLARQKAKYLEMELLGVECGSWTTDYWSFGTFYIDRLWLPDEFGLLFTQQTQMPAAS